MLGRKPPVVLIPVERTRKEYVTREVNVHEHRAPTDESVRLLREMEAKAEAEVIKAVSVSNTSFECVVHQHRDAMSDRMRWNAVFKLNGKQACAAVETDPRDHPIASARDHFEKLRDAMAKVIAEEILDDAFVAVLKTRLGSTP